MSKAIIKFSTEELKQLLENKDSCVSVRNSEYSLALYPYHLSDCNSSIKELLNLNIGKYEKKLCGILLGYKNIKLLSSDGTIVSDSCHIHLDIQADFYIFKPEVGCNLVGIVNKKSDDHVGCLVHRLFNISIPKPDNDEEWVGYFTEIGQEIVVNVTYVDLESRLPYIRAQIDLDHFQVPESANDKSIKNELDDDTDNITVSPSKKKKHKNKINELLDDNIECLENKKSKKKKEHKHKKEEKTLKDNDNNEISLDEERNKDDTKKNIKKEKNIKKKKHSKSDNTEYENDTGSVKEKNKHEEATLSSKKKIKNELNYSTSELNTIMADHEDRKSKKRRTSSLNGTESIDLKLHDSDLEKLLSESNIKYEKSTSEEISSHEKNKKNKSIDNGLLEENSSGKKNKKNKSIDNGLLEENSSGKKNKKNKSIDNGLLEENSSGKKNKKNKSIDNGLLEENSSDKKNKKNKSIDHFTEENNFVKKKRKRRLTESFDEISEFTSKKRKHDPEIMEEVLVKKHKSKRKSKEKEDS